MKSSSELPIDLAFDILLRLPAKSIARCRCVSKPWASLLRRPEFTESFLTRSHARPLLLFACRRHENEVLFFSSPQPDQDLDETSSSIVAVDCLTRFDFGFDYPLRSPLNGFICTRDYRTDRELVTIVCNPTTGQSFTLPDMETTEKPKILHSFIGYDPIEKQFKVLSMTEKNQVCQEHQVLTLGTREPSWRRIECGITSAPRFCGRNINGICINGVVYYDAGFNYTSRNSMIACFDVRNEKYSFIEVSDSFVSVGCSILVNYKGKLASLSVGGLWNIDGSTRAFEMYVLEDPDKHEWSKHIYEFPPQWRNVLGRASFHFRGLTSTSEVVISPNGSSNPFYLFYYSLESETMRRVEIQGMGDLDGSRDYTFVDYVENVKLMEVF